MIYYRVGDTLPSLRIQVQDAGQAVDITNLDVYVHFQRGDGTIIAERTCNKISPFTDGLADFVWLNTDLTVTGVYNGIVQLTPTGQPTLRYSLTNPPLLELEVLPNVFASADTTLSIIPKASGFELAQVLQRDISTMDGPLVIQALERARTLAWTYCEFWRAPNIAFSATDSRLMRELVKLLGAREYISNPVYTYGPLQKEMIGSYSYEMKQSNVMSTRQQTGGKTGIPNIDALIDYFIRLSKQAGPEPIGISFPDYNQPITYRTNDPLLPIQNQPPFV